MTSSDEVPKRAHEFICKVGADTQRDLVNELHRLAEGIERGEVTTGCSGSPSAGVIYTYHHNPAMTHDAYFAALNAYLEKSR